MCSLEKSQKVFGSIAHLPVDTQWLMLTLRDVHVVGNAYRALEAVSKHPSIMSSSLLLLELVLFLKIHYDSSFQPCFITFAYCLSHTDDVGCVFKIDFQNRNTSV